MRKRNLQARDKQGRYTSPIETPTSQVDMKSEGPRKGALMIPSTTRGTRTTTEVIGTITMGS